MSAWLQFRTGDRTHCVVATSGPMHLIRCGVSYHGTAGALNPRAKRCGTCAAMERKSRRRQRKIDGDYAE